MRFALRSLPVNGSFQTTRGQEQQLLPIRPLPQTSEWRRERFELHWMLASRWPPRETTALIRSGRFAAATRAAAPVLAPK